MSCYSGLGDIAVPEAAAAEPSLVTPTPEELRARRLAYLNRPNNDQAAASTSNAAPAPVQPVLPLTPPKLPSKNTALTVYLYLSYLLFEFFGDSVSCAILKLYVI